MKRQRAGEALINQGFIEKFRNRCQSVVEDAGCPVFAVALEEADVSAESRAGRDDTYCHLSLSEIFMQLQRDEWRSHDFLAIVTIRREADPVHHDSSTLAYFVGPATIRNQAMMISSGVMVADVPIGRIPCSARDSWELSMVLYRVRSSSPAQKVLKTVENMIPVLDYEKDLFGSMVFAGSILDRVKVISQSPDAIPVLAGRYSHRADDASSANASYVAVLQPMSERDRDRQLFIKNGRLHASLPGTLDLRRLPETSGRGIETATPARFQDFGLIRVGTRLSKRGPTRSIHQLRRERLNAIRSGVEPSEDRDVRSYLDREARLRRNRQLAAIFGTEGLQRVPVVTPIAIEVAGDLIGLVESGSNMLNRQFQELLNVMKDGLRYELGIEVPGVRIRGNPTDLPKGSYIIMIDEIPLVRGDVVLDRALCNATVNQLKTIKVEAEATVNPANGNAAAWVKKQDWDKVKNEGKLIREEGLYLWEIRDYMILHLSAVVRKNASEFLGVKAVADLIRAKNKASYPDLCGAPGGLPRLTAVLRTLLEEEVSINEFGAISAKYLELARSGMDTHEIVAALRCLDELRPSLRLRSDSVNVYELGKNFVALLRNGTFQAGDAVVLALEPEPTKAALSAVRNEVANLPPTTPNPVILVEDWRLRRPARKLIELEFPHLWVLARRELADPANAVRTIGVIELD